MTMTKQDRKEKQFSGLNEAVAAVGETRHIDFLVTIAGQEDMCMSSAYAMTEFKHTLRQRGFGTHEGDSVKVWLL